MPSAVFTLLQAYDKLMLLAAGAVCAVIGALVLLYPLYLSWGARRYRGEVVGVRQENRGTQGIFWPVIAYTDGDGQRHEALGNTGSSQISAVPGMPMNIVVKPAQPERCASTEFGWIELLGLAFLVPGIMLFLNGIKHFPVNWLSILLTVAFLAYVGVRISRGLRPLLAARTLLAEQRDAAGRQDDEERRRWPLLSAAEIASRVRSQDAKVSRALPYALLIGLGLTLGGAWWGHHRVIFMATAASAQGQVIGSERSESGSSTSSTYHAIVRFSDTAGNAITYRDEIGANPPSFRVGEHVLVYYDPQRPEDALIDRGLWNWLVPLLVGFGGFLLLLGGIAELRKVRRRATCIGPALEAGNA